MRVPSARPACIPLAALSLLCASSASRPALAQNASGSTSAPTPAPSGAKAASPPAAPPVTPQVRRAIAQFQMAAQLSKSGQRVAAVAAFQEYLRLAGAAQMGAGALLPAYENIYRLQLQQGDTKGMESTLGQMARLAPQNPGVYSEYVTLYMAQHRFDDAKTSADRVLALKPTPLQAAQAHFARGAWAFARKEWSVAETEYQASANLAPGNPHALYNLLLAQNEQRKVQPALATAAALLKSEPHNTPARLIVAGLHVQNHDLPAALAAYQALLKYEPRNVVALFNEALLYQQTGRINEAITAYAAVLDITPREFGAHYNLGLLYAAIRNPLAAQSHYAAAARIKPTDTRNLLQLALTERERGLAAPASERVALLRDAEQHFKQLAALDPADPQATLQLAALYERDNRFEQALALYRQQQQADPDNPEPYARIAHADLATRQLDAAIAEWRTYRSRKPGDPRSYGEVADLLEAQGKWKDAQEERRAQAQRDPKSGVPHLALAYDARQLKQTDAARAEYETVLGYDVQAKDAGERERPYVVAARTNWRRIAWRGLAEIADESGKFDEAALAYDNIKTDELAQARRDQKPPDARVYKDIAELRERAKQPELARAALKALTEVRPDDPNAFATLADFEDRQNKPAAAAFAYSRAGERSPDPVPFLLKAALVNQKHGLPDIALTQYALLAAKYPRDPRVLTPLAQALELTHDDARALAVYDTLLKATPDDVLLMDKKAVVLTRLHRFDDALRLRQTLADRDPQQYQAYANVGYVYAQQNKPDAYRQWLAARIQKTPAALPALAAYMDACTQQKREEEGWQTLRQLARQRTNDPAVQEAYAGVLAQHNRLEDALELRRQLALANPADIDVQTRLNDALLAQNKPDEADKSLEDFTLRPRVNKAAQTQARSLLARQLVAHNKTDAAIAQYIRLLADNPNDFPLTLALGTLYAAAGRDQAALALYAARQRQADAPAPLRAHYAALIGDLYAQQGLTAQAQAQYREALRLNPQSKEAAVALQRLAQPKPAKNTPSPP